MLSLKIGLIFPILKEFTDKSTVSRHLGNNTPPDLKGKNTRISKFVDDNNQQSLIFY